MKKFSKITESKDLSYKSFFGKEVSHMDSLKNRVINSIIEIIREEKKVSEKSFSDYDAIIKKVKESFSDDMFNESVKLYNQNKRISYIAEMLYDNWFKN